MTTKIRFIHSVYRDGALLYEAGKDYDRSSETEREMRRGHAVSVEQSEPRPVVMNEPKPARPKK